jgi:NAD+ diphosphatase
VPPAPQPVAADWGDLPLGGAVDRAAERRTVPGAIADALHDPGTRVLLVHRGRLAVRDGALDLVPAGTLPPTLRGASGTGDVQAVARWLLLGRTRAPRDTGAGPGALVLALVLPDDADAASPGIEGVTPSGAWGTLVAGREWVGLRDAVTRLPATDLAFATPAVALANWHATHVRCPRCGEPTVVTQSGWVRRCEREGVDHFPRTDPAVIMAVVDDDDRLLLGHGTAWAPGRFSTLAGYVEPGESAEQAVRREVHEEVGVAVGDVAYRASQPWPFPASLMLGFRARAQTAEIRVDADEVDEARWFTRDELARAAATGEVGLPGAASIARALVEDWFGGALPEPAAEPGRPAG